MEQSSPVIEIFCESIFAHLDIAKTEKHVRFMTRMAEKFVEQSKTEWYNEGFAQGCLTASSTAGLDAQIVIDPPYPVDTLCRKFKRARAEGIAGLLGGDPDAETQLDDNNPFSKSKSLYPNNENTYLDK